MMTEWLGTHVKGTWCHSQLFWEAEELQVEGKALGPSSHLCIKTLEASQCQLPNPPPRSGQSGKGRWAAREEDTQGMHLAAASAPP